MGAGDALQTVAHSFARVYSELYGAYQPRLYRAECREAGYACAPAAVGGADVQFALCAHVRHGAQGFAAAVGGDGVNGFNVSENISLNHLVKLFNSNMNTER